MAAAALMSAEMNFSPEMAAYLVAKVPQQALWVGTAIRVYMREFFSFPGGDVLDETALKYLPVRMPTAAHAHALAMAGVMIGARDDRSGVVGPYGMPPYDTNVAFWEPDLHNDSARFGAMSQSDVRFEEHYVVQYPPTDVVYSVRREILLRSLQVATNSLSMGVTLREALAAVYTLLDDLREDRVRVQTETKVDQGSVHTAQLTSNVKALWEQAAQHTKAKMKESEFEAIVTYLKLKAGMVVSPKKTPLLTQLALFAKVLVR